MNLDIKQFHQILLIRRIYTYLLVLRAYEYYPNNYRLYSIKTGTLQNIAYGYDNVGNVTSITDSLDPNRTQYFSYDELNRLRYATSPSYNTIEYQYDQIGNITYNSRVGSYTYSTKPHAVTTAGSYSYSYDANGNMTTRNEKTITYDYDNRATSITGESSTVTNVYDYSGQRIKKTVGSSTTIYIGKLYECNNGTCTKHIFAGGQRIASKKIDSTETDTSYYHGDHLGSTTIVTDSSGIRIQETYYYPFGETRVSTGSATNYKYTGQEEDPETGLYYYGARYYDPIIGRFISADSIVQAPDDPQTLNRYSYCGNNPIIYTDPSGHLFGIDDILIGMAIGAIIGGTSAAITGGNIWQGIAMGAISGAFMGAASGYGFVATVGAGAAGGGVNAAIFGGNIGQGMLYGAIGAAAGYGIGQLGIKNPYLDFGAQVAGGGIVGGAIAELTGGSFSQGFAAGAVGAAMGYGFGKILSTKTEAETEEKATYELVVDKSEWTLEWAMENATLVAGPGADFAAGFGDTITFGGTKWIRGQLGINDVVNFNSGWYRWGEVAGHSWQVAAGGAGGLRGAAELSRLKSLRFLNQNRYLRTGYGKWPGVQGRIPTVRIGPWKSYWNHFRLTIFGK